MATKQKIIPNLWFDNQAEEAAHFYASVFNNSKVGAVMRAGKAGFDIHHIPEGAVMNVEFELEGYRFIGINGGPLFKLNPSISFLVACQTREEVDALWKKLSVGTPLIELGAYPHSERYGWLQDKYGVSWQLMFMGKYPIAQKITPTLMFTGANAGKAEEAINFYASIFRHAKAGDISRYGKAMEPDEEGSVQHGAFALEGQQFAAMDSARPHNFAFNEAISLMVECENQREIDWYWDNLVKHSGQESVCGWLKDKFGVSWQVAPKVLGEMLRDTDKQKVERVTNAFLKMKKIDIAELQKAYEGKQSAPAMSPVVHFEMPYTDSQRLIKFYSQAFGWQMQKQGKELGEYVTASTTETDENRMIKRPGAINGGFFLKDAGRPDQYPSVVIAVDDIKEAMKKVADAGGKVLGEPVEIPGIGQYVSFRDTEGNRASLLQSKPN